MVFYVNRGKSGRQGGGRPRASIVSRGAKSATAAMEGSRDTIEFSRENAFRVYKTISRVKMFSSPTIGKKFFLN